MRRIALCLVFAARVVFAQGAARPDAALLKDSLVTAELRFFLKWDSTWKFSERDRHQFSTYGDAETDDGSRHQNYHCHPEFRGLRSASSQGRLIPSSHGWFAVCPSFEIGDVHVPINERIDLDQALGEARRKAVRAARSVLLAKFDTVQRALPADDFVVGQRVRLLIDQWEFDAALRVAQECTATAWWCAALGGYVHAARSEVVKADSAFKAAFAAMPAEVRCRWTDYRLVVDFASRDDYSATPCERRDALNARLWWLADPLYIEPGNEREVEQNVRTMLMALRAELGRDERFSWNPQIGNDAREAMITRYGWPAYMFWGGPIQDRGHTGYLAVNKSPPNAPYTTYEYSGSRVHTIPVWGAIADPFHANANDWVLTADADRDSAPKRAAPAPTPTMYSSRPAVPVIQQANYWWPVEHFQPRRPIVQLPTGQQAFLRRQNGALLAVATDLVAKELGRVDRDSIPGITLVTSSGPNTVQRVSVSRGVVGSPIEVHGMIGATPVMAGLEFPAPSRLLPAGRLRFGAAPPLPLSALAAGELATSDPVILRALPGDGELPSDPEAALRLMATSHRVSNSGKMGVYWETYGFKPVDSVEVAVWVERSTGQSIVRRFGIVLGVATDLNTPVATSWKEPDPGRRSFVSNDGGVPIIGRSVTISVAAIPPGEYRLEVAVRKAGQEPVVGRTTFIVP
jgi:hypothetical protein